MTQREINNQLGAISRWRNSGRPHWFLAKDGVTQGFNLFLGCRHSLRRRLGPPGGLVCGAKSFPEVSMKMSHE